MDKNRGVFGYIILVYKTVPFVRRWHMFQLQMLIMFNSSHTQAPQQLFRAGGGCIFSRESGKGMVEAYMTKILQWNWLPVEMVHLTCHNVCVHWQCGAIILYASLDANVFTPWNAFFFQCPPLLKPETSVMIFQLQGTRGLPLDQV